MSTNVFLCTWQRVILERMLRGVDDGPSKAGEPGFPVAGSPPETPVAPAAAAAAAPAGVNLAAGASTFFFTSFFGTSFHSSAASE